MAREYVNWMDSFRLNKRKYFESQGASPSHLTLSIEKPLLLTTSARVAQVISGFQLRIENVPLRTIGFMVD